MNIKLMVIIISLSLSGCGGGGDSEETNVAPLDPVSNNTTPPPDVAPPSPVPDPDPAPVKSLDEVLVPEQFDWSMYKEGEVKIKTVSTTLRPDGVPAGLGGKHYMKIIALDAQQNEVAHPLQRSLTDRTGNMFTTLKFPDDYYGIKVEVTVDDETCSEIFTKEQVFGEIAVTCEIAINLGDGE